MDNKDKYFEKPADGQPWDVIIIGSGPASFTAAIYTTRGAASTLILGGEQWGGQLMLTTDVDNYPGFPKGVQGPELMLRMRNQAERFSAEFVQRYASEVSVSEDGIYKVKAGDDEYLARSLIIATGADTKWLGIPGEDKLRGRGVSSCAPCDAPFFKDKNVIVVGGGDSAMEEALVLTKYAKTVTLVHRRNEFRASAAMEKKVLQAHDEGKVNILWDTEVKEMVGENILEKVVLQTKFDSEQATKLQDSEMTQLYNGSIVEEKDDLISWEMPIDGVFVAIGHIPSTGIFKNKIELDEKGYVKRFEKDGYKMATSVEGIFVAGDVHDYHYRQAITASAFGCMAGMDALKYLDKNVPLW